MAPHPAVLLEPVANVALAGGVLAWQPFPTATLNGGIAALFALLGLLWAEVALRKIRGGAVSFTDHSLRVSGGFLRRGRRVLAREEIVAIEPKRGASRLAYDPLHVILSYVSRFGYLVITTRDGRALVVRPVDPDPASTAVTAWLEGRAPVQTAAWTRGWELASLLGLFVIFGTGVLTSTQPTGATWFALIAGAGLLEAAIWVWVFSPRS